MKCADQLRDVVLVLAQRRQRDLHHLQPVVQILAEAAGRHLAAPAGGWWRRRCARRPGSAARCRPGGCGGRRARAAARLHRQRQLGHLVEEQRAALRVVEQAVAALGGAGECALGVAEQLGLDALGRHRRACHRHERRRARAGCRCAARARRVPCRCPIRRSAAPCSPRRRRARGRRAAAASRRSRRSGHPSAPRAGAACGAAPSSRASGASVPGCA